MGGKRRQR